MNTTVAKAESKNEIVVYQPNETTRLDVRLRDDTVWLSQRQMSELFGCSSDNIGLHLKNIYADGELDGATTAEDFSVVRKEGKRMVSRLVRMYNLEAIISVGFRVNSRRGIQFRRWANGVIQQHMLQGVSVNQRMIAMEDRIDRRLSKHDADIVELLIVDNTVWHVGASLKDAGNALFAMMKMKLEPDQVLALLK